MSVVPDGDGPKASPAPGTVVACAEPRAGGAPMLTLKLRADFLRTAQARRQGVSGFLLQARDRQDGDGTIRVGYTASKKTGNAVTRNRAKRRLRALARQVIAERGRPGWDYVLVARPGATVTRDHADLLADLHEALTRVHGGGR
ncbi:MAG: ribonuclease P protein component [Rhodobacterales bacterium]|nr:ribonuclease P protein component [Rhodobacterales bacterium]